MAPNYLCLLAGREQFARRGSSSAPTTLVVGSGKRDVSGFVPQTNCFPQTCRILTPPEPPPAPPTLEMARNGPHRSVFPIQTPRDGRGDETHGLVTGQDGATRRLWREQRRGHGNDSVAQSTRMETSCFVCKKKEKKERKKPSFCRGAGRVRVGVQTLQKQPWMPGKIFFVHLISGKSDLHARCLLV